LKHLFSCLKTYRTEAVLAPLFKLLEACMELLVPFVVKAVVDHGIADGNKSYIIYGCLILAAFGVVGLAFALTAQYFAARAAVGTSAELRSRLFAKLQSFSYSQIDGTGTAAMVARMTSDVNQVQTGVNMTLRIFLRSPIVVFGATAMAFVTDARTALVFLATLPLLIAVVVAIMAAGIPLYRRVQGKLDRVYGSVRDNLTGVRVIRAFCKEQDETEEFSARNGELCRQQKLAGKISALMNPLTFVIVNAAAIALVYFGALRIDGGKILQGDVIALYSYLSLILVELVKFASLIFTITKAISCEKRIGAVLDVSGEPEVTQDAVSEREQPSMQYAAEFRGVSFTYSGGGAPALQGIDFSVRRGETVGILGGTGSGKSTLVNLLPRFYSATEGSVLINGKDVEAVPYRDLRQTVAVVPQKAVLFQGTIRSNLLWGNAGATDEELETAVRIAQAEDVVKAKGGLDGEIAQEGKNLSGGQRQRLTVARALVQKSEILILDDSSSALDYATDAKLRAALKELDRTLFVVSQRASSVRHADKIIVLDDGKIAGMGTHEELSEACALYREICASQEREGV
jgi:ABC-type multidrug transport system fused ATPase/permease subunit